MIFDSQVAGVRIVARYRSVLWEPIESTGERVVALLCVEPAEESAGEFQSGTHVVLRSDRLRAIFGPARGNAAHNMLSECARFMTSLQSKGTPIEDVLPLFRGFSVGPVFQARAYSVKQLLDAAVRTVSAFGSAEDIVSEPEPVAANTTRRTADFIRAMRVAFAADDEERKSRFHVRMQREQNAPEVWVDYASGHVVMQVTSVPGSASQAPPAVAELKSKILDLEVVRGEFGTNRLEASLMLNIRALEAPADDEGSQIAKQAHSQILTLAEWAKLKVIEVSTAADAARALERI